MPREVEVKSVLNKTKKRDPWFLDDYTINLYSSCAFNCLYCYIRGSKYGTNLEQSMSVKTNAIEILDRQLYNRAKKQQYGVIVLSSATEPYMSIEKDYELTRNALKLIKKYKFPVHVITKSDGIERDFNLLQDINATAIIPNDLSNRLSKGVIVSFSFSTLDDTVANHFEKGATPPSKRLITLQNTVNEGFLTGVSLMPLLPFISDTTAHLNLLFSTFKASKVDYILPATLTLFGNGKADSKTLILNAIKKHYPQLEDRYNHYFKNSNGLPNFYRHAFSKKMKELSITYGIKDFIEKK